MGLIDLYLEKEFSGLLDEEKMFSKTLREACKEKTWNVSFGEREIKAIQGTIYNPMQPEYLLAEGHKLLERAFGYHVDHMALKDSVFNVLQQIEYKEKILIPRIEKNRRFLFDEIKNFEVIKERGKEIFDTFSSVNGSGPAYEEYLKILNPGEVGGHSEGRRHDAGRRHPNASAASISGESFDTVSQRYEKFIETEQWEQAKIGKIDHDRQEKNAEIRAIGSGISLGQVKSELNRLDYEYDQELKMLENLRRHYGPGGILDFRLRWNTLIKLYCRDVRDALIRCNAAIKGLKVMYPEIRNNIDLIPDDVGPLLVWVRNLMEKVSLINNKSFPTQIRIPGLTSIRGPLFDIPALFPGKRVRVKNISASYLESVVVSERIKLVTPQISGSNGSISIEPREISLDIFPKGSSVGPAASQSLIMNYLASDHWEINIPSVPEPQKLELVVSVLVEEMPSA